ncbi:hypothetical protein PS6_011651, partial [Mucor atramentarius]
MATDSKSDSQTGRRQSSSTGNVVVDYTKLTNSTASVNHDTNFIKNLQKMESDQMALIIRKNQNQDFNAENSKYLEK